jgi:hypothetical protein
MKTVVLPITKADQDICFYRVVQTILEHLPEDYPFFDDVFVLSDLTDRLDKELRKL